MSPRRSVAAVALILAAPVLSSCGSSFGAQTDQVYQPAAGVDARDGSVDVLNALVVSAGDGSGTIIASLVNNDTMRSDELVKVAGAGSDSSLTVTPGGSTTIPNDGMLNLATQGKIFVRGDRIKPGYLVELTFSFKRGEPVTLDVPVVTSENPTYSKVPLPS